MLLLHKLIDVLRKRPEVNTPQPKSSTRLRLEELEDRIVPSFTTNTYTNASVAISPGLTVTETVTATVTPFQGFDTSTGKITPIPTGATNPTSGTVFFNLNNQIQSATLNANGQATATYQIPLLAFLTSQTLTIEYLGASNSSGDTWESSTFFAPLYKNFTNVMLAATLTFNQLTPQQVYAEEISGFQNFPNPPTTISPYNSAQGETDSFVTAIGPIAFNYIDPGTINTITALGNQYPGILALQLGAFGGFNTSSNSK